MVTILAIHSVRRIRERITYWRCSRFVRKFRAKHPDLIKLEREMKLDHDSLRFAIAQQMAARDNEKAREEMERGWKVLFFTVWDYMMPRNKFELRQVLHRMKERRLYAKA